MINTLAPDSGVSVLQTRRGYTLTEVLVSLAIVMVLTLVAMPLINTTIKNNRLKAVADTLLANLQYARTEAIKNNTAIHVSFVTGDAWCYGINSGSACTCTSSGSCGLGTTSALSPGQISLATSGMSSQDISFESTHAAASASSSITLTLYGESALIKISISRMGNLQICSTGISGYTAC